MTAMLNKKRKCECKFNVTNVCKKSTPKVQKFKSFKLRSTMTIFGQFL